MKNMHLKLTRVKGMLSLNLMIEFGCIWGMKDSQLIGDLNCSPEWMVHSKSLNGLITMHTSWNFQMSIMLLLHLIFFYLSLFNMGDNLRLNPFKKMRDDENQQATPQDLFNMLIGPITKARAKISKRHSMGWFKTFRSRKLWESLLRWLKK